jgi:hypothetical protein
MGCFVKQYKRIVSNNYTIGLGRIQAVAWPVENFRLDIAAVESRTSHSVLYALVAGRAVIDPARLRAGCIGHGTA